MCTKPIKGEIPKTAILIVGPTAVGKTGLSIQVARHFQTEILSADSRQCFREMRIGTAVPSRKELETVPHHFIQSHSITEEINAGIFEKIALNIAKLLFRKHAVILVVGGTGLYLKAFCEGIDPVPAVPKDLKLKIEKNYREKGLSWLQNELKSRNIESFRNLEKQNPQRLMRALGVLESTGKPIHNFQTGNIEKREFKLLKIGLRLPKEILSRRIETRVDQMFSEGLEEEARKLYPYRHLNALQTVGYKELFDYFEGNLTLPEARNQIITHTRQYAKRQMTWFRKDPDIHWFTPHETKEILEFIERSLNNFEDGY